jgi:hypothetical protein
MTSSAALGFPTLTITIPTTYQAQHFCQKMPDVFIVQQIYSIMLGK